MEHDTVSFVLLARSCIVQRLIDILSQSKVESDLFFCLSVGDADVVQSSALPEICGTAKGKAMKMQCSCN